MPELRTILTVLILGVWIAATEAPAPTPRADGPRLSFMLSPAPVAERALSANRARETTLRKGPDGHFRAEAELDGRAVTLLVDTGASAVVLSEADARGMGIPVDTLTYDGKASTANGVVRTARIEIARLRIGSVTVKGVRGLVTQGALDVSLLGMSFLGALGSFEFEGDELVLRE